MEAVKRKLFISLEGLVKGVVNKSVTAIDLKNGLFCLGCSQNMVEKTVAELLKDHILLSEVIINAIAKANRHGRCRWVIINEKPAYYHLNFLLVDNGFKVLKGYEVCSPATYHEYTAENIISLMAASNPSLQVVF